MLQVGNDPFIAPMMRGIPYIIANSLAKTLKPKFIWKLYEQF